MDHIPSPPICSETEQGAPATTDLAPRRMRLNPAFVAYARSARQSLLDSFGQDVTAPERVLIDMVAAELPVHGTLVEAEAQLATRLETLLLNDDIKLVAVLARAMRQVSLVSHAVGRRVEQVLSTAVALKAQRRLTELHRKGTGQ